MEIYLVGGAVRDQLLGRGGLLRASKQAGAEEAGVDRRALAEGLRAGPVFVASAESDLQDIIESKINWKMVFIE